MSESIEQPSPPGNGNWRRIGITLCGVANSVRQSVLSMHMRGKTRRFWLVNFRKGYVQRHLARRRGDCRQCGVCCALGYTCPTLHKGRQCMIYHGYRPKACCIFPVDERDIADVAAAGGKCGYNFEKAPPRKSR